MDKLHKALEDYGKSDYYPFHMPGHKRNTKLLKMGNPYEIDITEIDGFDNLHQAEGLLKETMEKASELYKSGESYFLVNGSTSGILIAMSACTNHGDKIIMARNCHRAVYHGVLINELSPVYLYPKQDDNWGISLQISPTDVDNMLKENKDAKLVIVTSPTYEGIISNIKEIANIVHQRGIPLIVDEAHGAHLGFHSYFPENSIENGADIVIHSVHKTLPAFTQTAILHVNGDLVQKEIVKRYFSIYQSSSPSYLLLAGIEKSLFLIESRKDLIEEWIVRLQDFYKRTMKLKKIKVLQKELGMRDPSKLVISVKGTNWSGAELFQCLREQYHLQLEAEFPSYVIAMTSMADTKEGYDRLLKAMEEIDSQLDLMEENRILEKPCCVLPHFEQKMLPYQAELEAMKESVLEESIGLISGETVFLYPPGIPIIVPGEMITVEFPRLIRYYKEKGLTIKGLNDKTADKIMTLGGFYG